MSLRITAYLYPFFKAFATQINSDDKRWADEQWKIRGREGQEQRIHNRINSDDKRWADEQWKIRGREGQEQRIHNRINEYFDDYFVRGVPVPWLKIVGEAFIGWVREMFPDFLTQEELEDDEPVAPV